MKNIFKGLLAFGAMALVMTGCKSESNGPGIEKGEKSTVSLTIRNASDPVSRAATDEENASPAESDVTIGTGLKVVVFNEDGSLDYTSAATNLTLTGTGPYTSAAFSIIAGVKYFFVFANDAAVGGKVTMPAVGSAITMDQFMAQVISVAHTAGALDITAANNFLLGSMWKVSKNAAGGGTTASPVNIQLEIGRLASKINVAEIQTANTTLAGAFSAGAYRIGSLPKKINTVGIHTGSSIPVGSGNTGVMVTSAVHNTSYPTAYPDANYERYSGDNFNPAGTALYTTENTTALGGPLGQQFYGNTTFIQLETVYTPASSEVYDPATLTAGATLTDNNFWTGYLVSTGDMVIFNRLPTTGDDTDIDYDRGFGVYTGGKNYHKFPVYDKSETAGIVYSNRVLRNHYYEFKITNFISLGSPDKEVDPEEPIDAPTTVTVEVTVMKWNKVSDDVEV